MEHNMKISVISPYGSQFCLYCCDLWPAFITEEITTFYIEVEIKDIILFLIQVWGGWQNLIKIFQLIAS